MAQEMVDNSGISPDIKKAPISFSELAKQISRNPTGPDMSFADLKRDVDARDAERELRFAVRGKGRPEMNQNEAMEKEARRRAFGNKLRSFRDAKKLTLAAAAKASGIQSVRKLSQYEGKCYPPGEVLAALSPIYGVSLKYLAALKIANSDPESFLALSGGMSPEEFSGEDI